MFYKQKPAALSPSRRVFVLVAYLRYYRGDLSGTNPAILFFHPSSFILQKWEPARALPFADGLPRYRTTARLADPVFRKPVNLHVRTDQSFAT